MATTNTQPTTRNGGPAAGDFQAASENDMSASQTDQTAADGSASDQGNPNANPAGGNPGANDASAGGAGAGDASGDSGGGGTDSGATGGGGSGSADASGGGSDGGGAATDGSGADNGAGVMPVALGDLTDGLTTDGLSDTVSDVIGRSARSAAAARCRTSSTPAVCSMAWASTISITSSAAAWAATDSVETGSMASLVDQRNHPGRFEYRGFRFPSDRSCCFGRGPGR